jgi:hypothetical protein
MGESYWISEGGLLDLWLATHIIEIASKVVNVVLHPLILLPGGL